MPVGTIDFAHDVPDGWSERNGAAVSRTKYARLFKKIGTKYGAGDGSTTFNLPNLHHRVLEGYSDQTGGSNNSYEPSGVFSHNNLLHGQGIATTSDPNATIVGLNFKASKANALYKGNTLQTASLRLLAIIKS